MAWYGMVWWFLWLNIIGFILFKRWHRKEAARSGLTMQQLAGFLLMGTFLYARLARPVRKTWWRTFMAWSGSNILVVIAPLVLMVLIQYLPILTVGTIPFVGPGGVLTTFMINLVHVILKLILIIPVMTWFYQLTGKIYLGSLVAALLVT